MPPVTERHRERAKEFLALRIKFDMGDPVASLAALLAEVEAPMQARCAALEAALASLERDNIIGKGNELGEDYVECCECEQQQWGSADVYEVVDINHAEKCPFAALSGSDSALKAMLVRAASAGCESAYEDASSYCQEDEDGRRKWAEAIAERVMRGE